MEGTRELALADPSFKVQTPEGATLAVEGRLGSHSDAPPDEDRSPDGARYEVAFAAEGYLHLARVGRAERSMPEPEIVVLPRR